MSGIKNISMSKEKNNINSGRRIHMKRYIPKIIVTILLVALCLPLNIVISNAASKDAKNVRSAYASVLKKKKYLNNQEKPCEYATFM